MGSEAGEGDASTETEGLAPKLDHGNRWYDYLPLVLIGTSILVGVAEVVAFFVDIAAKDWQPRSKSPPLDWLLEVGLWSGVVGWGGLFFCYFAVAARKRVGGFWWGAGGLCPGVNLLLYVALLWLEPRTRSETRADPARGRLIGRRWGEAPPGMFACEGCAALLNFGVSECHDCGTRYSYDSAAEDGDG